MFTLLINIFKSIIRFIASKFIKDQSGEPEDHMTNKQRAAWFNKK